MAATTAKFLPRIKFLYLVALFFCLLFIARLFSLQIVEGKYYLLKANNQNQEKLQTALTDRGSIFFSNKNNELVPAAIMQDGYTLAINPSKLESPEQVYGSLSKITMLDRDDFFAKASKKNDPREDLINRLDSRLGEEIDKLKYPGVMLVPERWRYYPLENLASHVVGFFAYDESGIKLAGRYGVEKFYNDILTRSEDQSFSGFLSRTFSELSSGISYQSGEREGDIVLTIEPRVQALVEEELKNLKERYSVESAGAIVLNPMTGEIFALTILPNFDPNAKQTNIKLLANPFVENVYEMGSVMKPLTMAAALDSHVLTPETTYFDAGAVILNGEIIQNYDGKGRGTVSMQEVLNQSLNTGAVFAAQQLGRDRLRQYFLNYGLGQKTGIDLPAETEGLVKNLNSHQDIDYASDSFGQGIAVTPIELTRALASLANGGQLIRPHLVKSFNWHDSKLSTEVKSEVQGRVLKPETSKVITEMLIKVVDTALLGGTVKLPNYQIAAKTGTAQMVGEGGVYDPNRMLHSFFGYFPATQPQFLIFMYLVNPQGVRYASESLTVPFMDLTKFLLNYYEVPPDRNA